MQKAGQVQRESRRPSWRKGYKAILLAWLTEAPKAHIPLSLGSSMALPPPGHLGEGHPQDGTT